MTDEHIHVLNFPPAQQLAELNPAPFKINQLLPPFFPQIPLTLIHFNLHFPNHTHPKILLAHHISPHTSPLSDIHTQQ
ncbi:phosphoribosylaminoimidazolesuccinocarboxamide synthase, partial [Cytobacillus oceanisediminis]|uniref:phosphoribosylaminoimidazolesuccinocarboxamide synthase n=1 Tax=Cytobacillus oceanisediminis TaxID=665099 RepID=UPI0037BF9F20